MKNAKFINHKIFQLLSELSEQLQIQTFVVGGFVRDCLLEKKSEFKDIVPKAILDRDKHPLKTDEIRNDPMRQRQVNQSIWRNIDAQA